MGVIHVWLLVLIIVIAVGRVKTGVKSIKITMK